MSCQACEKAIRETPGTEIDLPEGATQPLPVFYAYVRVGNANVLISGCKEHMDELLRLYNLGLKFDKDVEL